jgi:hypothetical protein
MAADNAAPTGTPYAGGGTAGADFTIRTFPSPSVISSSAIPDSETRSIKVLSLRKSISVPCRLNNPSGDFDKRRLDLAREQPHIRNKYRANRAIVHYLALITINFS